MCAPAQLATGVEDAALRRRGGVGDGAIGGNADRAAERHQIVGDLTRFGRSPVRQAAEAPRRVEGCEHTHVVAAAEELLGKRLDVPVHAALIGPGIWRDKRDAHEGLRVTAG